MPEELISNFPQLDVPQVSRRSLLTLGSLMALNLVACGGDNKGTTGSSSGNAAVVSTLAGSTTAGFANGTGTAAAFNFPTGVAVDASGNVYVADYRNPTIRQIVVSTGEVTTLAGSTTGGHADGTGTAAQFLAPYGVAVDASGNVFVADYANQMIRKIVASTGAVTTLAGSTTIGHADGTGAAASFNFPIGVAADTSGNLYVSDSRNHMIRKIVVSTGVVTTLAGSTTSGAADGTGPAASFNSPAGVAVDTSGNVYVADTANNMIRKIVAATGVVTTLAGSTTGGAANGSVTTASFRVPTGVAVDASGNIYVADAQNNMIRKIA